MGTRHRELDEGRIDPGIALFMVEALENDELVQEAPAIVGRETPLGARARRQRMNSSVRECAGMSAGVRFGLDR